jgi:hypothetical protein
MASAGYSNQADAGYQDQTYLGPVVEMLKKLSGLPGERDF